jgi:hypothetical protein
VLTRLDLKDGTRAAVLSSRGRRALKTKQLCVAGLALLTLRCSSAEPTVRDQLIGTWAIEYSPTSGLFHAFNEDGSFEMDYVEASFDGSQVFVESSVGSYELRNEVTHAPDEDGTYLFTSITHSTCPDTPLAFGELVELLPSGSLRLATPSSVLVFEPVGDSSEPTSLVATFGCFGDDGLFYPRPLEPM